MSRCLYTDWDETRDDKTGPCSGQVQVVQGELSNPSYFWVCEGHRSRGFPDPNSYPVVNLSEEELAMLLLTGRIWGPEYWHHIF